MAHLLLLRQVMLKAERTRMRVQIYHWLIDDLRLHKVRRFYCRLLILNRVFRYTRIRRTCGVGTHCTKIRYDWLFVMRSCWLRFALYLLWLINLLLDFTHPLVYQSLDMFRIVLLRNSCSNSFLRLFDSCKSRILITISVIFGLLWFRVNFEFFFLIITDDVLVYVSALPREKSLALLLLGQNVFIIFIYVIGIKNLSELVVLIDNPWDEICV